MDTIGLTALLTRQAISMFEMKQLVAHLRSIVGPGERFHASLSSHRG